MAEPEVDWQALVQGLVSKGHGAAAGDAQQQAIELRGTPDYWEAVYTLARQRVQMGDAQ